MLPDTRSSRAIWRQAAMPLCWRTSSTSSYLASLDGTYMPLAPEAIWAWLSSRWRRGERRAVATGRTPISRERMWRGGPR